MQTIEFVDALRATQKEICAVTEVLERRDANAKGRGNRTAPRYPYRWSAGLRLVTNPDGGGTNKLLVWPRDISSGGMSFLHGSLLYRGTPCSIILCALDGEPIHVEGVVVRCDHVCARFHDVGFKFNQPIDLTYFVDAQVLAKRDQRAGARDQSTGHGQLFAYTVALNELIEQRAPRDALLQQIGCLEEAVKKHIEAEVEALGEDAA
jgi:hypothetical protein